MRDYCPDIGLLQALTGDRRSCKWVESGSTDLGKESKAPIEAEFLRLRIVGREVMKLLGLTGHLRVQARRASSKPGSSGYQ
jgi:hypothetical protein